jgi:hypothetical protein
MNNTQEPTDWFKKLKGIIIKEDESDAPVSQSTATKSPSVAPVAAAMPSISTISLGAPDESLVDNLMLRFQKLIEEKNQPGFDFFEYSAMVLGVSTSPAPDHFKMAFQGAKVMNPQVSKQQLLDSANFYKQTLEAAYLDTIKKGEEKRTAIAQQQANEQKQLNTEVATIGNQIAEFEKKIAELRAAQAQKNTLLTTLAEKFAPQMSDVESKLNATSSAKDRVQERLLLVEDGLKKFVE